MYLVNEENIILLQTHQDAGKITGLIKHRTRRHLKPHTQFIGYDIGEGGLAKSRRSVQQRMVKCLLAKTGRLHKHTEILYYLLLTAEIIKCQRTEGFLYILIRFAALTLPYVEIFCFHTTKLQKNP